MKEYSTKAPRRLSTCLTWGQLLSSRGLARRYRDCFSRSRKESWWKCSGEKKSSSRSLSVARVRATTRGYRWTRRGSNPSGKYPTKAKLPAIQWAAQMINLCTAPPSTFALQEECSWGMPSKKPYLKLRLQSKEKEVWRELWTTSGLPMLRTKSSCRKTLSAMCICQLNWCRKSTHQSIAKDSA